MINNFISEALYNSPSTIPAYVIAIFLFLFLGFFSLTLLSLQKIDRFTTPQTTLLDRVTMISYQSLIILSFFIFPLPTSCNHQGNTWSPADIEVTTHRYLRNVRFSFTSESFIFITSLSSCVIFLIAQAFFDAHFNDRMGTLYGGIHRTFGMHTTIQVSLKLFVVD